MRKENNENNIFAALDAAMSEEEFLKIETADEKNMPEIINLAKQLEREGKNLGGLAGLYKEDPEGHYGDIVTMKSQLKAIERIVGDLRTQIQKVDDEDHASHPIPGLAK